jgi:alpha-tubulin suppressor-like RCC1 family protein
MILYHPWVQVCCGWRHTVMLDDRQRVWVLGSNKHGQLGSPSAIASGDKADKAGGEIAKNGEPVLVSLPPCLDLASGWSHIIAMVEGQGGKKEVWGWGRNHMGQLGLDNR